MTAQAFEFKMVPMRGKVTVDPGTVGPATDTTVRNDNRPGRNDMFNADLAAETKR